MFSEARDGRSGCTSWMITRCWQGRGYKHAVPSSLASKTTLQKINSCSCWDEEHVAKPQGYSAIATQQWSSCLFLALKRDGFSFSTCWVCASSVENEPTQLPTVPLFKKEKKILVKILCSSCQALLSSFRYRSLKLTLASPNDTLVFTAYQVFSGLFWHVHEVACIQTYTGQCFKVTITVGHIVHRELLFSEGKSRIQGLDLEMANSLITCSNRIWSITRFWCLKIAHLKQNLSPKTQKPGANFKKLLHFPLEWQ